MGKKKRSWFSFVKKLFIPHTKSNFEKTQKTRKWGWIFGGVKIKQYPEIGCKQMRLCEATEEQRKQVVAVAIATAAAAEAAIAAANAAAEVVKLTNYSHHFSRNIKLFAAIKIQCSFRRHLARKALNAMRGLVKLQAVIRGENVRRRVNIIPKMKRMNLLEKSSSRIHRIRVPLNDKEWMQSLSHNILMDSQESNIHDRNKSWDLSIASKEEMETLWIRKEEAVTKRERMKKYSYSHRESRNDEFIRREYAREGYGFNHFDTQQQRESRRSKHTTFPDYLSNDTHKTKHSTLSSNALSKLDSSTEPLNSPVALRRRSFSHTKQESIVDDDLSLLNSPVFPTYMATTESAKAKFRSTSMPKQRLILSETYSGQHSPFKSKLSYLSSFNGDMNSCCRNTGIFKF